MALTDGDREWLTGQFDKVHGRINEEIEARATAVERVGSSIHNLKSEVQAGVYGSAAAIANAMNAHKEANHNAGKTLGGIALLVGIGTGIVEAIKFLLHISKDGK